ncbi:anti-phage-associated DUF499 domain-containing protein [Halomonas sp. KO116]|uniref:anti-phage-associated DUF499 domain-containing protein n=1 Tax=Halomonas sp. KO116 TaxID=1504981 RepID=UPI0004E30C98|nr:anti-phage-associated DUF499 domain-containing protein [Halomonas sp. KO116]AJY53214.1 Fn3 associated repeat containing protein [Halomonas sp. KO116]
MLKTVKQACVFNSQVMDYQMAQAVEHVSDLITGQGDGTAFFERNYVTQGMAQLFNEGLLRLSGKSDQAVFELSQAMGGGKTHLMIALGLMAKHPHLRQSYLPKSLESQVDIQDVNLAAFNGRNAPNHYVWGEIASQLGKAAEIRDYWADGPRAVDEAKWMELIGDAPTLIVIDEIPPYLSMAATQKVGDGTLASLTTYTLSCLMSAALKLPRCAVVIANLSGAYEKQTSEIRNAISDLQNEASRQAKSITPVSLEGSEIYQILRKRLITEMPDEDVISEVANAYASRVKAAKDGGHIDATYIGNVVEEVEETYPFHPSFKHIVALFKDNEGFRQTRGLMQFAARLAKSVLIREQDDVYLIGAQHFDLNDPAVRSEFTGIATQLTPALARDIADNGNAIAEEIDAEIDADAGSAQQISTLILSTSLSRTGGRIGLTESEILEFLAAPNRKPSEYKSALAMLQERAWYLHREEERYYFKETENLTRQIERMAKDVPSSRVDTELIRRITAMLTPRDKLAYQHVLVMPELDSIRLGSGRVLIVVRPDGRTPPEKLNWFFEYVEEKNSLAFLTGMESHLADAVEARQREAYAIEQICNQLNPGDTLYQEAQERREDIQMRLDQAIAAAYNRLYFPSAGFQGAGKLGRTTIQNNLSIKSAEQQLEALLASASCDDKLALNMRDNLVSFFSELEEHVWPKKSRRVRWQDAISLMKTDPALPWLPGANGLETLKQEALKQGRWRDSGDGYIEKGPFPQEKTTAIISVNKTSTENGTTELAITPRHAGANPVIHVAEHAGVSNSDPVVETPDEYVTDKPTLYFLVVDSDGKHIAGEPVPWNAILKMRHQIHKQGDKRLIELQCTPQGEMTYTLDGSNPKEGTPYKEPFEVEPEKQVLLVHAEAGEASASERFTIPAKGDNRVQIDDKKPTRLTSKTILDATAKTYAVLNHFKSDTQTRFRGVRIEVGEGEHTVSMRFSERATTAAEIELALDAIRKILNDDSAIVTIRIDSGAAFVNGFEAKEFARLAGVELKPEHLVQGGE